jgi:undecaprenyl-diphosphatase
MERMNARCAHAAGLLAALPVFAWLAGRVAAGATIGFDAPLRAFVHQHASPGLTAVMRFMSRLGEPLSLVTLGAGVLVALLAVHWKRAALRFAITMTGAFLLDTALKLAFHRPRPVPFFGTDLPHSYGFPSGHALFSVCFFGVVAALVAPRLPGIAARAAVWTAALAIVFLIGLSRVYLGVHYPSDVLGGYAAAVAWVSAVALVDGLLLRRGDRASATSLVDQETSD